MGHHHEEGEGDQNRVAGGEEAVDETGIEEGIGIGEIDKEMLVGRREVGGEVVLGGASALGHENFLKSRLWNRQISQTGTKDDPQLLLRWYLLV